MTLSPQQLTDYIQLEQARLRLESARLQSIAPMPLDDPLAASPTLQRSNQAALIMCAFGSTLLGNADQVEANVMVINADVMQAENAIIELRWIGMSGTVYEDQEPTANIAPNTITEVLTLTRTLTEIEPISILDLAVWTFQTVLPITNRYLLVRGDRWDVLQAQPTTRLEVRRLDSSGFITVINMGEVAALGIHLAADGVQFEDNDFSLLPAETRSIGMEWAADQPIDHITVIGWNFPPITA